MKRRTRYHLIYRVLVITAVVAALPLLVGFFLIQHSAKARLTDAAGSNFVWFAEHAATSLDVAFVRELEFLSSIGRMPSVLAQLSSGSRPNPVEPGEAFLTSEASKLLSEIEETNPVYREIVVLDPGGSAVAASVEAELLRNDWDVSFPGIWKRAESRADVSESWATPMPKDGLIALYRPIRDPDSGEVLGLVRGLLDTERLFSPVSDLRFGETGRTCLVERSSGRVLAASRPSCSLRPDNVYPRWDDAKRAYEQKRTYFLAGVEGPGGFDRAEATLVALARPQIGLSLPEANWIVIVEQSLAEAHAPLASLSRDLVLHFVAMGALVVLLASYVSYRLERPSTDTVVDLHQHRR